MGQITKRTQMTASRGAAAQHSMPILYRFGQARHTAGVERFLARTIMHEQTHSETVRERARITKRTQFGATLPLGRAVPSSGD